MKRILVGVDGSAESREAARHAAALAAATGAGLELAHALPELAYFGPDPAFLMTRADVQRSQQARSMLLDLAATIPSPVTAVETSVLEGEPAQALAEEAKRRDVWMVVVGHRGRGAVERALLGSVADRLVQICPKPLLVVR